MISDIIAPLIVAEDFDVSVFRETSHVETYLEAIDVSEGVHRAWDSTGQILFFSTGLGPRVQVSGCTPARYAPEDLRSLLVTVLSSHVHRDLSASSLPEVLAAFIAWAGYCR